MFIRCVLSLSIGLMVLAFAGISPAATKLTLIHTNDLHSHVMGFSPNRDYTPMTTGDDDTVGGWARIASVIKAEKAERQHPVLAIDAGDFLMGSLFHMVSREEALELVLMKEMGIDLTTLGNHEFDLKPEGLARILETAGQKGAMPGIVASNLIFDPNDPGDDRLEALFRQGVIRPWQIVEKDGIKIGVFGLVGNDAAEVAPFASPVSFGDPVQAARDMVKQLRDVQDADLVICLSHSGLSQDPDKSEDEILAREVDGIDVIISGHTHTRLEEPIVTNNTVIVQSWAYGRQVGVMDLELRPNKVVLTDYRAIPINDSIAGDTGINAMIDASVGVVNQRVLKPLGLGFDQVLVETGFDLTLAEKETNLGNLVTDAIRWKANQADPVDKVDVAIQSNGVIRDYIIQGKTGKITVSDLFRVVPLGIGWDNTMSYPLVAIYVTGEEMKKAFEVLTTVHPLKGEDYYLQVSGVKMTYNPLRMLFDRVTSIGIEDNNGTVHPVDYSGKDPRLYKVVTNIYNATFLKIIGSFTSGILTIVPKDRAGNPIEDLSLARLDGNREYPGIQEIKDWTALMDYVQTFEDRDGNGIPEIPDIYRSGLDRVVPEASISPLKLMARGNYITWLALGAFCLGIFLVGLTIYLPLKIIRKRNRSRV